MITSSRPDLSVEEWIEDNLNKQVVKVVPIGNSSWSSQYSYLTRDAAYKKHSYFVKTAPASKKEMFDSEAIGLNALHRVWSHRLDVKDVTGWLGLGTGMVVVPEVKHVGTTGTGLSFLVADYLDLKSGVSPEELGKSIAYMHLAEPDVCHCNPHSELEKCVLQDEMAKKGYFGFPVDNTLGGTPQPNGWMDNWVDFFRERRLRHQLRLAGNDALYLGFYRTEGGRRFLGDSRLSKMGEELCEHLELFFEGYLSKS